MTALERASPARPQRAPHPRRGRAGGRSARACPRPTALAGVHPRRAHRRDGGGAHRGAVGRRALARSLEHVPRRDPGRLGGDAAPDRDRPSSRRRRARVVHEHREHLHRPADFGHVAWNDRPPTPASAPRRTRARPRCRSTRSLGLRLWQSGRGDLRTPLSAFNNLSPDTIGHSAGNMTGVEMLTIGGVSGQAAIVSGAGCGGTGQRIYLDVLSTPAIWRLAGMSPSGADATYGSQLAAAFPTGLRGRRSLSGLVDQHDPQDPVKYAATCATTSSAFISSSAEPASWNVTGGVPQPYIDLDANSSITLSGVSPNATINPVHRPLADRRPNLINPPGDAGLERPDEIRPLAPVHRLCAKGNSGRELRGRRGVRYSRPRVPLRLYGR